MTRAYFVLEAFLLQIGTVTLSLFITVPGDQQRHSTEVLAGRMNGYSSVDYYASPQIGICTFLVSFVCLQVKERWGYRYNMN